MIRRTVPFWFFPAIFLVVGFGCGFAMSRIEIGESSPFNSVTYSGNAEASRSLVTNVLGGIISITTLTLTITIITIQLASSQYSPRLMKRYLHDRKIQLTVGFFFFVYAFTIPVLFHIRAAGEASSSFIPHVALTFVILLAVLMLGGLIYFVFHVTRSIRVEKILEDIARTTNRVLDNSPQLGENREAPAVGDDARVLLATGSGFVTRIDVATLDESLHDERSDLD